MNATVFNIFDLEIEWQSALDGFSNGVDFKTWLAANVIQLRDSTSRQELLITQARKAMLESIGCETKPGCECPICKWFTAYPIDDNLCGP